MIEFIRKIIIRKYKKEELIKQYEEQKLIDIAVYKDIRGAWGRCSGLGR